MPRTARIHLAVLLSALTIGVAEAQTDAAAPTPLMSEVHYLAPADVPKLAATPKKYDAPKGFGGRTWGELRNGFTRLPAEAASIRAAWKRGEHKSDLGCTGTGRTSAGMVARGGGPGPAGGIGGGGGGIAGCSMNDAVNSLRPNMKGGGFRILSEYIIEGQGFRFSNSGVLLHPVVYEFCAHWEHGKGEIPQNFEELNKLCGMRLLFETEALSQLRDLPGDHVSHYELVLRELIARYGKPDDFVWHGRVTVEPLSGGDTVPTSRDEQGKFQTWRWCPMPDLALQTRCPSSIVLSADPNMGRGIVVFAAPALWQFADAREKGLGLPDPLFTLLHGLPFDEREALRQKKLAEAKEAEEKAALKQAAKEKKAAEKAGGQGFGAESPP